MNKTIIIMIITLLFSSAAIVQSETVSVPQLINYQGMLTNAEGQPLETKEYKLSISIFNQPTGGTAIWGPQIFDGRFEAGHGAKVPVVRGHFNVILGQKDINGRFINDAFQTKDAYLEITVENNNPIMPRQQILSSPYAIQSLHSTYATTAEVAKTVHGNNMSIDSEKGNIEMGSSTSNAKLDFIGNFCIQGTCKNKWPKLKCIQKSSTENKDDFDEEVRLYCDPGYTLTGGGCSWRSDGNDRYIYSHPDGNGWFCQNLDGHYISDIWVICCKVE